MTNSSIYNIRWKLPNMLFGYLNHGRKLEIMDSMSIDSDRLLSFLAGEDFPTEDELKGFCENFKLRHSTLKTWNVLHLIESTAT